MANALIEAAALTFLTTATAAKGIGKAVTAAGVITRELADIATIPAPAATLPRKRVNGQTKANPRANQVGIIKISIASAQPLVQRIQRSTSALEITASLLMRKGAK